MAETASTPGSGADGVGDSQPTGVEVPSISPSPEPAAPSPVASEASEPVAAPAPEAAAEPSPVTVEPPAEAAAGGDSGSSGWVAPVASDSECPAAEPVPTSEPPAPATAEVAASQPEGVVASLSVPPLEDEPGTGGEWELLVSRVQGWLGSGELQRQWQRSRGPLKALAILMGVILVLRLYSTAVNALDAIPVVSGLLELAGLIAVIRFMLTRLVRSSDRRQVLDQWTGLWRNFRGQG